MSENKINLVVPKEYNGQPIEMVFREGIAPVALDPKAPERVFFEGPLMHLSDGWKNAWNSSIRRPQILL